MGAEGRITMKLILEEQAVRMWTGPYLSQNRVQRWAVVDKVINLRVL
jgi:hypothetical protein